MINFFDELKRFIENNQDINTDGLFFEYRGSRIAFTVAEEIYMNYFPLLMGCSDAIDTIDEQKDFIRLLREENARLRGEGHD